MLKREIFRVAIFNLFFVIIIFSSFIIPVASTQFSNPSMSTKKGDYLQITNFNDFEIFSDSDIISDKKADQITFDNNYTGIYWDDESYFFNFNKYGNITDCVISLTVKYYCNSTDDLGRFYLILHTNYSKMEDDYTNHRTSLCGSSFGRWSQHYFNYIKYSVYEGAFIDEESEYFYNYPLENTLHFNILKEGDSIYCEIQDADNGSIVSKRWKSYSNYVYTSGLELFFSAENSTDFTIEANSFNAIIEIENRNWKIYEIRDTIIYVISGIIITIAVILSGVYIFKSMARRMNRGKTREQIILEQEFKAWDEKLSPERVLIITHLKFEGKTKKDDKCGICKTTIKHGKEVYQCHNCETLFHKEHLIEWFKKKDTCPVCKTKLL